MSDKPSRSCSN